MENNNLGKFLRRTDIIKRIVDEQEALREQKKNPKSKTDKDRQLQYQRILEQELAARIFANVSSTGGAAGGENAAASLLVGGAPTYYSGNPANAVYTLDDSANEIQPTVIQVDYSTSTQLYDSYQHPNGNIFLAGVNIRFDGSTSWGLIILNSAGELVTRYTNGMNNIYEIRPDTISDKVYVCGVFTAATDSTLNTNLSRYSVMRLNSDGSLDATFPNINAGSIFTQNAVTMDIDSAGNIYVGGGFTGRIFKFDSTGTLDSTFSTNRGTGFSSGIVGRITYDQYSDKIYVIGYSLSTYNGVTLPQNNLIRMNLDGTIDNTFDGGGSGYQNAISTAGTSYDTRGRVIPLPDGKLWFLMAGYNSRYITSTISTYQHIMRLNSDGTIDTSFPVTTGSITNSGFNHPTTTTVRCATVTVLDSGNLLVTGTFNSFKGVSCKEGWAVIDATTAEVTSEFAPTYSAATQQIDSFSDVITSYTKLQNGTHLITIDTIRAYWNHYPDGHIYRCLLSDYNTRATNFGTGFNSDVYVIKTDAAGNIYIAGAFTEYNGTTVGRIVKLNSNFELDTTFNTNIGTGFSGASYDINFLADGSIICAGGYNQFKGVTNNRIIVLNPDGTKNTNFDNTTGFNNIVYTIDVHNDIIYAGGLFTTYKGVTVNRICALNSDGSIHTEFQNQVTTGFSSTVTSIYLDTDLNRLYVTGGFIQYNSVNTAYICALTLQGIKDTTFAVTVTGGTSSWNVIRVQSDGKVLVGGATVANINGTSMGSCQWIRLNTNGTVDLINKYPQSTAANIYDINTDGDGNIYLASNTGTIYVLDSNGNSIDSISTSGGIVYSLNITNSTLK